MPNTPSIASFTPCSLNQYGDRGKAPKDWRYGSFHSAVKRGWYDKDWELSKPCSIIFMRVFRYLQDARHWMLICHFAF